MFLQTEQIAAKNRQRLFSWSRNEREMEERRKEETETAEVKKIRWLES